ncbi:dihydroorotase [Jeotgalibacillus proteolyticus]|uniref:Dihydroorotase n=1 Tax=Jeotgalibacillus proteolyticus TaxID=2082395 RepID=A0A2S5GGR2_9BACL|nr:dihydroorotase [Jeotgalibacillus proteolyticus]PPA72114.1 dihydroorotase [Jeotgalibacillus proteolyticus]
MNLLIKNVIVSEEDKKVKDIRIKNGSIEEIGADLSEDGEKVIDGNGYYLAPGFVDVHVHLREPGGEHKETIETGSLSAARGGFTTICAMPNTRPVPDNKETVQNLLNRIEETAKVNVMTYASITERQVGKNLVEMEELAELGVFAFTDDGVGIQSADMMYQAMKRAAALNKAIVAHCEDNTLIHGGCMHEGARSAELNLPGIPSICESVQIARDVLLAEAAGCHYHVCHVSTKESVRVIRDAKKAGIRVTAEVTPHHLLLNEEDITEADPMFKMNPPLRSIRDQKALLEGLEDGTIDFIATDHAPHSHEEKAEGMKLAPFGIVGLETAFTLLHTRFVKTERWSLTQLIDWLTIKPASVFGLESGTIEEGKPADLVLIDLQKVKPIDAEEFLSKGKNTPFNGLKTTGWPVMTIVNGEVAWEERN